MPLTVLRHAIIPPTEGITAMQLPWYLYALGAAVVWGIHYPLVDYALKRFSLATVLFLTALPILLLTPLLAGRLAADLANMRAMSLRELAPVLALCITTVLGSALLFVSIAGKNATLASLIEITYPAFVALFAWLLFRDVQLTPTVAAGGLLILAGVSLIIWHNP